MTDEGSIAPPRSPSRPLGQAGAVPVGRRQADSAARIDSGEFAGRPCSPARLSQIACLALSSMWSPATAQDPPLFEAEAALMEVEVRVTDGRGRAVTGLSREDFALLENGREQEISTFEFMGGLNPESLSDASAAAGAIGTESSGGDEARLRRSTFIYIATRGRREDRPQIYDAVREFIDEHLRPGVFVSLEGSPFTSRRSNLRRRLDEMLRGSSGEGVGGGFLDTLAVDLARDFEYPDSFDNLIDDANEEFEDQIEEIADRAAFYRRLRMYEYIDLIRALGIYPGRKIVVLFSTGLPVDEDNIDIMRVLEDEATKARVRFFVSDVSRLSAAPPGGDAETAGSMRSLMGDVLNNGFDAQAQQRQDNQDGLWEVARRTGGRAVLNSNDFGKVFEVVDRETSDYYLLGYYPEDTEQRGRLRRLRVRVAGRGLRVSHQRGYYEQRPFQEMSRTERNLRLHQALTFDTPYTELPVVVDHEFFRNSAGTPTLVYSAGMHVRDIPAASSRKGETLQLTVVAQASPRDPGEGESGRPVTDERRFEIKVPKGKLQQLSDEPHSWLHYGSQMSLAPGDYDWKVVVRDDVSGLMGSFQTQVRIPSFRNRLGASSLLLTSRIDDVGDSPAAKSRPQRPENVLEVDGSRFFASATKRFRHGDPIFALYDVYNASPETLASPPSARIALYHGNERVARPPVTAHQTVPEPSSNRLRFLTALSTSELPVGSYTIAAMLPAADSRRLVIYRKFEIVRSDSD